MKDIETCDMDPLGEYRRAREVREARAVRTAFLMGWLCCAVAVAIVESLR